MIASRGDALIRIGDVATTELGPESVDSSSIFDGEKAVFIGVNATPTANPLEVITAVRKEFPSIQAELPAGMTAAVGYDATKFIRASIAEVEKTLAEAALIVVAVIFLFLGNLRSTLIPIVTIPLSLVGVMIALLALGYSINLLTLLAMVLAIGLVVDDAIVVVENIYRHIEEGLSPHDASIQGAREITGPVISMTITLAAVYAPIGFVSGLTGALFREFAFALAGSVVVSGVIALTLSPMMCSKLLRPPPPEGTFSFARVLDRVFEFFRRVYSRLLVRSLNFRALTMLVLVGVLALTGIMFVTTPHELAPEEDQGVILTLIKAPQYGNLDYLERSTLQLSKFAAEVPEYQHLFAINGYQGVSSGFAGIILKNWEDRKRKPEGRAAGHCRRSSTRSPGAKVLGFSPPALPGSTGGPPIQFVDALVRRLQGDRRHHGKDRGRCTEERAVHLLGFGPEVRHAAARDEDRRGQGQPARPLDAGDRLLARDLPRRQLRQPLQSLRPLLRGDSSGAARRSSDARLAHRYQLRTSSGDLVPLSAVASVRPTVQPNSLPTFQQLNSATLSRACRSPAIRWARRSPSCSRRRKQVMPGGLHRRLPGREPAVRAGGQHAPLHVRLRAHRHLSRARRAVRELPRSLHHPDRVAADLDVRRAAAAQTRSASWRWPRSTSIRRSASSP